MMADRPPRRRRRARWRLGLALVVTLLPVACGSSGGDPAASPAVSSEGSAGVIGGEMVVQAAASLTGAFTQIGADFEAAHPAAEVTFNFAGSQTLASQILHGAPVDVFASASPAQMERVIADGLAAGQPRPFATNRLAIAVQAGNPHDISGLADLAARDLVVVLAAPGVPAGAAAAAALQAAEVELGPSSLEVDVRAVLAKVALGEADAGIVYASDLVRADPSVEGVQVTGQHNPPTTYPIAVVADAPNPGAAQAFLDLVVSDRGQDILAAHGFGPQ